MNITELIDIVKEASKLMLLDNFEISQKDGFSNIVTSSDIAVQEFLCERLATLLPSSGFICEEFTWHRTMCYLRRTQAQRPHGDECRLSASHQRTLLC